MTSSKSVLIIGTGLGGLSTGLRLLNKGYRVKFVEKYDRPGGRLNQFEQDGFTFDMGPSFFSMSYEFDELFKSCGIENPLKFNRLDPLYTVNFADSPRLYNVYRDLNRLAEEFPKEKDFVKKTQSYLKSAGEIFHDTEYKIVKRNYSGLADYALALATVPLKHGSKLFRTMWKELEGRFDTEEVKVIFSLVAFFLGATPFDTPAVYSLLNYTELVHDGYWNVQGGMYRITEEMIRLLSERGAEFSYNTEITGVEHANGEMVAAIDQNGISHTANIFVCNADAAFFRGKILKRPSFEEKKLDKMEWTLAPFTIYLGVKGKVDGLKHHNYFLGSNFREYSDTIFKTAVAPDKPYYYVNVSSKSNPECAPDNCENLFILCPVPDLRFKKDWSDTETLADNIIADLSARVNFDLAGNTLTRKVLNPIDWQNKFNLYKGSGLGLAHGLNQVGGMRPKNKDEKLDNLYYVGASTVPGTGLPIVVISSRLAVERIIKDHA